MRFIRIGNRVVNLDRIAHCEVQIWHDTLSVKIFLSGSANNTPIVLNEDEAKLFWAYMESTAEKLG